MSYAIPACDKCNEHLVVMKTNQNMSVQQISINGYEKKRRKYLDQQNDEWLQCNKCYQEWDLERDSAGRIIKGDYHNGVAI